MVPAIQARPLLEAGKLCEVMPGTHYDVALSWYCWSIQTALTRALTESIVATAAQWLGPRA